MAPCYGVYVSENEFIQNILKNSDPSRRRFLAGLIGTAVATPTVVSFAIGKLASAQPSTPGNAGAFFTDPSGNFTPAPYGNWIADPVQITCATSAVTLSTMQAQTS